MTYLHAVPDKPTLDDIVTAFVAQVDELDRRLDALLAEYGIAS